VDGVKYKCLDEMSKVAEAKEIADTSERRIELVAFRNFLEVNGERFVLRKIAGFKKLKDLIFYVPSNVEILEKCGVPRFNLPGEVVPDSLLALLDFGARLSILMTNCIWGNEYQCESLRQIIFESDSKLKEFGDSAFCLSGIKSIRIPNNVERIGSGCFCCCQSLYEVTFGLDSKLKQIGYGAFCL
jgi:hypothetical protein